MKLNINAANIITAVVYVLVISIFAAFVGYYWWVWQYAFNLVIAPIFGIKAITLTQAAALSAFTSLITGGLSFSLGGIHNKIGSKPQWMFLSVPFFVHIFTWLLVG